MNFRNNMLFGTENDDANLERNVICVEYRIQISSSTQIALTERIEWIFPAFFAFISGFKEIKQTGTSQKVQQLK